MPGLLPEWHSWGQCSRARARDELAQQFALRMSCPACDVTWIVLRVAAALDARLYGAAGCKVGFAGPIFSEHVMAIAKDTA
jgi:hypothetical protein